MSEQADPQSTEAPTTTQIPADEDEYIPKQVVSDDLDGMSLEDAIAGTIVNFDDGDIVKGTVVKVDKDEVLLDIGYKSEGVIPILELSIPTTSIPTRSSAWVRRSRPLSSRRRTRKAA